MQTDSLNASSDQLGCLRPAGQHERSKPYALERLTTEHELDSLRDEWKPLAASAGNLFGTPEWVSVWWRHFGAGRQLAAIACRSHAGRLVGVVPLYELVRRPITVIRFIGHGPGDVLSPVCDPADREGVCRAVRAVFSDRRWGWDLLLAERMPADEGWSALLGGRLVHREPSPVVRLAGMSWDEFLSSRSRNFRQQLQRCERRLSRHDGYRIRLANDPDLLERDMQILMSLHDARWAASETRAFAARRRAIHLEWAAVALARGWLRLWLMEVGGTPIAAWYGFRYGGAEWYYQSGRDPAWSRESAGFVLMCHSIQAAMHDGATEYRMLRGGEAYKARFTSDNPDIDTIVLGNSLVARSAAVAAMLAKSLPSSARHRLSNAIG